MMWAHQLEMTEEKGSELLNHMSKNEQCDEAMAKANVVLGVTV